MSPRQPGTDQAAEAVPLSQRVVAMSAVRVLLSALLLTVDLGSSAPGVDVAGHAVLVAVYLVGTGLLSALVITGRRAVAMAGVGAAQLVDIVVLATLAALASRAATTVLVVAAYLVAVSLLASFRTGIKLAVWSTIVALLLHGAAEAGLLGAVDVIPVARFVLDQMLIWAVGRPTCSAAAVSERELRRRRIDAEALRSFATGLHQAEDTREVSRRVAAFLADELDASRVVVVRRGLKGPAAVADVGAAPTTVTDPTSALLDVVTRGGERVLALRLDPALDPWLAAVLPGARRLLALPLSLADEPIVVVVESGGGTLPGGGRRLPTGRGSRRVDRRFVAGAEQAVATASLAYSRAELLEQARAAASTDALTGLANRRVFDDSLRAVLHAQRSRGETGSLVLVDVDHFKAINDTYGHPAGDEVLRVLARTLRLAAGPEAVVARYGGEEFAVLLPGRGRAAAAAVAEACRSAVQQMDAGVAVTASFGVATTPDDAVEPEALVDAADAALIRAKTLGRNRVVVADAVAPADGAPSR